MGGMRATTSPPCQSRPNPHGSSTSRASRSSSQTPRAVLGRPGVGQGLGQLVAPSLVFYLQGAELVDGVGPPPQRRSFGAFATATVRRTGSPAARRARNRRCHSAFVMRMRPLLVANLRRRTDEPIRRHRRHVALGCIRRRRPAPTGLSPPRTLRPWGSAGSRAPAAVPLRPRGGSVLRQVRTVAPMVGRHRTGEPRGGHRRPELLGRGDHDRSLRHRGDSPSRCRHGVDHRASAYGWPTDISDGDALRELLALNLGNH